jgi:hypothetical protein
MRALSAEAASSHGMEAMLCLMNTETRHLFDMDGRMRRGTGSIGLRTMAEALVCDGLEALGRPADRKLVRNALRRHHLHLPRHLRLDDHVILFVQPMADWGGAFTPRQVFPTRPGACAVRE